MNKICPRCKERSRVIAASQRYGMRTYCRECAIEWQHNHPRRFKRALCNLCEKHFRTRYSLHCRECQRARSIANCKAMAHKAVFLVDGVPKKKCPYCFKVKDATIEIWGLRRGRPGHLREYCKSCSAERTKKWQEKHPEKVQIWRNNRVLEGRSRISSKKWSDLHHDKRIDSGRKWYRRNRKKKVAAVAAWSALHPDIIRIRRRARAEKARARNLGLYVEDGMSSSMISRLYSRQHGLCFYCHIPLNGIYDLDHKVPLSRGGSHTRRNLCCSCPTCNRSKHTLTAREFISKRKRTLA